MLADGKYQAMRFRSTFNELDEAPGIRIDGKTIGQYRQRQSPTTGELRCNAKQLGGGKTLSTGDQLEQGDEVRASWVRPYVGVRTCLTDGPGTLRPA